MISRYPSAEPLVIPKERVLIDAISLDEEVQLERELLEEEMRPVEAAWSAFVDRGSWPQPLPMRVWEPTQHEGPFTALQIQFLQHLVYTGQIGVVAGNFHRLDFQTAYEILREKAERLNCSVDHLIEAASLMYELRAVA